MKKYLKYLLLSVFLSANASFALTPAELEFAVRELSEQVKGKNGFMEFYVGEVQMFMVMDPNSNRMRIISPITDYKNLSQEQISAIMQSNFHRALDARYAVSNGVLYSAFIHPMAELTVQQLLSAIYQVANLSLTFGEDYSSGVFDFNGF
ncbi:hypothetical protein [Sessilibacter sp. MAH2]